MHTCTPLQKHVQVHRHTSSEEELQSSRAINGINGKGRGGEEYEKIYSKYYVLENFLLCSTIGNEETPNKRKK